MLTSGSSRNCINNVQTPASLQGHTRDSLYETVHPEHCWDSFLHSKSL